VVLELYYCLGGFWLSLGINEQTEDFGQDNKDIDHGLCLGSYALYGDVDILPLNSKVWLCGLLVYTRTV